MLEMAINGNFTEKTLDESMLSAIESKFSKYLSASELSKFNATAEREKIKELVSNISHQTKTPIANIILYSELLAEENLSDEARDCVVQLTLQSKKLSFLISSIVNLSRLETGIICQNTKYAKLMPMLEKIYNQYLPKAQEKELNFNLEETCSMAVFDERWTSEAIANIVDNAIKYTESGSVTIRTVPYEMFVCIEVTDTGDGISESEQTKIFQRFYRSRNFAETEGLGIGLYLARQIVSETGGYIKIKSKRGKGSTFSIFLPYEK